MEIRLQHADNFISFQFIIEHIQFVIHI